MGYIPVCVSNPRWGLRPVCVSRPRLRFQNTVHRSQISDSLSIAVALIYLYRLKPLTVVELTGYFNTGSGLKGPALTFSIIDSNLHIVIGN